MQMIPDPSAAVITILGWRLAVGMKRTLEPRAELRVTSLLFEPESSHCIFAV